MMKVKKDGDQSQIPMALLSLSLSFMLFQVLGLRSAMAAETCASAFAPASTPVFALSEAELLRATLETSFYDRSIYVAGRCGDNVARLALRLRESGAHLRDAKVVYLLHEQLKQRPVPVLRKSPLQPARSRTGARTWDYHVILITQDPTLGPVVLDLDYSSRLVPVAEYFAIMFPRLEAGTAYDSFNRLEHMQMRAVPVNAYLDHYLYVQANAHALSQNYLTALGRRYITEESGLPSENVQQFLNRVAMQGLRTQP